ncbi:hypothetical protein LCGC14_2714730 [marine sediment metagenome]|uniref:Uncharacterized protein n=1 Tax=marine sediment metagenome TaxID=412755 RepID=A0A0F8ZZH4_9ZZZZ
MNNEDLLRQDECPHHNCIEPAGVSHAHNTLSGQTYGTDWAAEYLAASQVTDMAKDPDDYRVTRQSKVTIGGLLVPVGRADTARLNILFQLHVAAFAYCRNWGETVSFDSALSATMQTAIKRAAARTQDTPDFNYISIDPRDYTIFNAPHVEVPIVCIHTRPKRCWFLGVLRFGGALGLSLGRMRVIRPNENGMYPITIRTKWRALTNRVKQQEVRSAYRRLIQA